jgi:hypothetical protein
MSLGSQDFESFIPIYDTVPATWEEGRGFLVEQLKKISTAVNRREIGWFLDQELLSGKSFIPSAANSGESDQYRSILRKVINVGPLVIGVNPGVAHGITFDINFTLIDIWVAGTDSATLTARDISGDSVLLNSTNIVITSPQAFNRAFCVIEYILEL